MKTLFLAFFAIFISTAVFAQQIGPIPDTGTGIPANPSNSVQYNAGSGNFGAVALTDGQLVVGATGSVPTAKTISGSCTLAATGVITCTALTSCTVVTTGSGASPQTATCASGYYITGGICADSVAADAVQPTTVGGLAGSLTCTGAAGNVNATAYCCH